MVRSLSLKATPALLAWLLSAALHATAIPPDRVAWQNTPIAVALPIGLERSVAFPGPVKVGVPEGLQGAVRVQSIAGTLYLLAHRPLPAARLIVQRLDGSAVYVLDLSAETGAEPPAPLVVYHPDEALDAAEETSSEAGSYGYVTLTRFAAQQLYAPARLLEGLPGVVRVPVKREPVTLVRGGAIEAVPLIAWRAGGLYLTAVKLTNQSRQAQVLDPRDLRGRWLTATFQHNRLLPVGDEADRTVAYLISARPFAASL